MHKHWKWPNQLTTMEPSAQECVQCLAVDPCVYRLATVFHFEWMIHWLHISEDNIHTWTGFSLATINVHLRYTPRSFRATWANRLTRNLWTAFRALAARLFHPRCIARQNTSAGDFQCIYRRSEQIDASCIQLRPQLCRVCVCVCACFLFRVDSVELFFSLGCCFDMCCTLLFFPIPRRHPPFHLPY